MSTYKRILLGGHWQVNKPLARFFNSLHVPIILDELIFHESKHADQQGWFYYKVEDLERTCFVGRQMRRKCFKQLIDSGVLKVEKRGNPCRFYYQIDGKKLDQIVENDRTSEVTSDRTRQVTNNPSRQVTNNRTSIKKVFNKKIKEEDSKEQTTATHSEFNSSRKHHETMLKKEAQLKLSKEDVEELEKFKSFAKGFNIGLKNHTYELLEHYGDFETFSLDYQSLLQSITSKNTTLDPSKKEDALLLARQIIGAIINTIRGKK